MLRKIMELVSGGKAAQNEAQERAFDDLHLQIRELAYKKWEEAGGPSGRDKEFWSEAEQELSSNNQLR